MPPLECANFLECENKTVCVAPFGPLRPSPWIQHQFFSIIYQNFSPFFFAKMAWNAIVCETTDISRENSIFPIFQKTWFQAILAKKNNEKKNEKQVHSPKTRILWSAQILPSAMIWQYVCLPSCGVRWRRWSAKNLWNAKNSEYAWLV